MIQIQSSEPERTERLGALLGRFLNNGDCVLLCGEIGTGKTVFAAGLAWALGVAERPTSPTFTLCNSYTGRAAVHHFDLYRLEDPEELFETGLLELLRGEEAGIVFVEWPQVAADFIPPEHISVTIRKTTDFDNTREITVEFVGNRYHSIENELAEEIMKEYKKE